jgi:transcriptional regulator with PAS, ATPase and Fis domain
MDYHYPGNVRELENIIEHAVVLCPHSLIECRHLPSHLLEETHSQAATSNSSMTLQELEIMHITNALTHHRGNRTAAAKALGINPSTLFRKIKNLGIQVPDLDGRNLS